MIDFAATHDDKSHRMTGLLALMMRTMMAFLRCRSGAVSPMMALLLLPISGAIAIGVEQGQWYYFQRSMQNAADAAAIAAAVNNNSSGTGSGYQAEAAATAAKFGYVNGTNGASVATTIVTCPTGTAVGATCYQTAISTVVPVSFSALIGFQGNTTYGTGRGQIIPVAAIATSSGAGHNYCLWSLSTAYNSFTSNGGPKPDLQGCSILSNGGATCNGHDLGADFGDAVLTNSGCGETQTSGVTAPPDPYDALKSNIPADTCSSYPQGTKSGSDFEVDPSNELSGSTIWMSSHQLCGDVQLKDNITLTGSNTTIIIRNGLLDLNGNTISTASGAAATIVFSGTSGPYLHYPTDYSSKPKGRIDIKAPTSGPWSGVAMYQDPALTSGTSFTYTGNSPAWDITGLVYLPKADVTFSGIVNKSSNGSSCFMLISYTILVNGTGTIFANNSGCETAGLDPPSSGGSTVTRLVQ